MKLQMKRPMMLLFLCVFLGTIIFKPLILKNYDRERQAFLALYENKEENCIVIGSVKDILRGNGQTILLLTDCTIAGFNENEPRSGGGVRLYVDSEEDYHCGNVVRAYGSIKVFLPAQNPGQFDAYEYYRREHLYANVYADKVNIVATEKDALRDALVVAKMQLQDSFTGLYPENEAGVIYALVTGDKSLLGDDIREDFKKAGISHILAVSGLHISFICLGFNRLLKILTIPKKLRDALTTVVIFVFVLFTGAGISVVRAGIMCFCMLLAENVRRKYDLLSALYFTGAVELMVYPLEGTTAAFLLSYGAILGVYAAGKIKAGIFSGLVITLFTLPVTLYFYYEFSSYGVLAGILVIPITGATLGFALLSGILGIINYNLGLFPAGIAYAAVKWMERVSTLIQELPFSTITLGQPSLAGLMLYYICLFFSVWAIGRFQKEKARLREKKGNHSAAEKEGLKRLFSLLIPLALVGIMSLCLHLPQRSMTFLSVGQGDGIVYHNGNTIVFDCGSSSESSVGKYILSPFLKKMGVNSIDMVVVSHMDSDHTSGVLEILENMPVYRGKFSFLASYKGNIAIKRLALPRVSDWSEDYEKMVRLAESKGVELIFLEQGDIVKMKECSMLCLWPKDAKETSNESSLVMLLATKNTAYLLTGDATTESEEKIISVYSGGLREVTEGLGYRPKKYILKVGHHGSKTSTSEAFLNWGDFDQAVISVGYFNTYGHPKKEILERLEKAGLVIYRTDLEGAIEK